MKEKKEKEELIGLSIERISVIDYPACIHRQSSRSRNVRSVWLNTGGSNGKVEKTKVEGKWKELLVERLKDGRQEEEKEKLSVKE